MKEIKVNEYWVDLYKQTGSAVEDFAVLFDFWKAGDATEEETKVAYDKALTMLDDAEFKATLNEPKMNCRLYYK
jgi:peptide chain release factor 2